MSSITAYLRHPAVYEWQTEWLQRGLFVEPDLRTVLLGIRFHLAYPSWTKQVPSLVDLLRAARDLVEAMTASSARRNPSPDELSIIRALAQGVRRRHEGRLPGRALVAAGGGGVGIGAILAGSVVLGGPILTATALVVTLYNGIGEKVRPQAQLAQRIIDLCK